MRTTLPNQSLVQRKRLKGNRVLRVTLFLFIYKQAYVLMRLRQKRFSFALLLYFLNISCKYHFSDLMLHDTSTQNLADIRNIHVNKQDLTWNGLNAELKLCPSMHQFKIWCKSVVVLTEQEGRRDWTRCSHRLCVCACMCTHEYILAAEGELCK